MTSYFEQFLNFIRRLTAGSKEVIKSKFGKLTLENDLIHGAHKIICNKNLKEIRQNWAFSAILTHSEILALDVFELKIVKLRRFFSALSIFVGSTGYNNFHP
jgi:hypothetical protein